MSKKKRIGLMLSMLAVIATGKAYGQNPYLPLWEYIPDSEPYVFEDPDKPGEYRVYIYGSHDSLIKEYCGREQVTWSASVNDLSNWRYDGVIFQSILDREGNLLDREGKGDVLYAPDVVEVTDANGKKTYYLYPNNQAGGRQNMVAKSDRPDGPFTACNWSEDNPRTTVGPLAFDPGVLVDDDGRVYAYWGFEKSWAGELDPTTMATLKPGTQAVEDLVSNKYQDGIFRFFEASSIRKIEDKYVFIYSRWTEDGEFGLNDTNYTLAYAYSDNPLGPFTYGGTIIDGRGRDTDQNGNVIYTANPTGNTHGSIACINGQWWVFYHRQTGTDEYARQAMVAPIDVKVQKGKGGKVTISEGEYTSEGFAINGLNPLDKTAAGIACYYTGPEPYYNDYPKFIYSGSYMRPTYLDLKSCEGPFNLKQPFTPVVNNTAGSTVGYKYFNFASLKKSKSVSLKFDLVPQGIDGNIIIMVGSPYESKGGKVIGTLSLNGKMPQQMTEISTSVTLPKMKGKQPLFFRFESATKDASICEIYSFQFKAE